MKRIPFEDLNTLLTLKVSSSTNYRLILFDNKTPMPSDVHEVGNDIILTWRIRGSFNTVDNKEYFNDVKEKLILLLDAHNCIGDHLLKGITTNRGAFVAFHNKYSKHQEIFILKDFSSIDDLRLGRARVPFSKYTNMSVFKKIRIYGYNLVEEGNLSIERLDEAVMRYSDNYKRDRHMANDVYRWIVRKIDEGRYYVGIGVKKITIPRSENAKIQSKIMFERNYKKFKDYIDFVGIDTKSVLELSKILSLSRPTIYKFIKIYINLKVVNTIGTIGGVAREGALDAVAKMEPLNKYRVVSKYLTMSRIFKEMTIRMHLYKPIKEINTHNLHTNYT